jgi:hypothetical protein
MSDASIEKGHGLDDLTDLKDGHAETGQKEVAAPATEQDQPPPTNEELAAVRRRIDRHLMPIMIGTYAIQFYDKTVLSQAALFGLLTDLHLTKVTEVGGKMVTDSTYYSYGSWTLDHHPHGGRATLT